MGAYKKYFLECLGTFALVFIVCGALTIQELSILQLSPFAVALILGGLVVLLVLGLGGSTGAHLNPAVTLCFCIDGSFSWKNFLPYVIAQLAGGFAAAVALRLIFPQSETLGSILQLKDDTPAFLQESWLSLLFLVASFSFGRDTRDNLIRSALVTGAIAFFAAWIAGPISGTTMNPARALAPAILSGQTTGLWIFVLAPICGAFAAAGLQGIYEMLRAKKHAS